MLPPTPAIIPQPVATNIQPQIPQQAPPQKREKKILQIINPNTHQAIDLNSIQTANKDELKSSSNSSTDINNKNQQTSQSNRNVHQKPSTITTPAPTAEEAKAIQSDFSLSVLKKLSENKSASTSTTTTTQNNNIEVTVAAQTVTPIINNLTEDNNNNKISNNKSCGGNVPKTAIPVGRNNFVNKQSSLNNKNEPQNIPTQSANKTGKFFFIGSSLSHLIKFIFIFDQVLMLYR